MKTQYVQEYGDAFSLDDIKKKSNEDILKIIDKLNLRYKKRLGLRNTPFEITQSDKFRIRDITGQIRISDTELVIIPKYLKIDDSERWQNALMRMLHISKTLAYFPHTTVSSSKNRLYFIDLLAADFINSLHIAIKSGLPLGYVKEKQESTFLRGRLDIRQETKNILSKPHLIACITESLTEDIPLSRVLKWACRFLSYRVKNPLLRYRLNEFLEYFSDVSEILPPLGIIERLGILGTQIKYQRPFQVAQLLIQQSGHNFDAKTSLHTSGVVFDSSTVFEEFISGCLSKITKRNQSWKHKTQQYLSLAKNYKNPIYIKPDDVLYVDGKRKLVLDSKYKKDTLKDSPDAEPQPSDIYQLVCSCQAASTNFGVLVYPSDDFVDLNKYEMSIDQKPKNFFTIGIPPMKLADDNGENEILDFLEKNIKELIS